MFEMRFYSHFDIFYIIRAWGAVGNFYLYYRRLLHAPQKWLVAHPCGIIIFRLALPSAAWSRQLAATLSH